MILSVSPEANDYTECGPRPDSTIVRYSFVGADCEDVA